MKGWSARKIPNSAHTSRLCTCTQLPTMDPSLVDLARDKRREKSRRNKEKRNEAHGCDPACCQRFHELAESSLKAVGVSPEASRRYKASAQFESRIISH